MSMANYDLQPADGPRPEFIIEGDALVEPSPYLTLQPLDAGVQGARSDPYSMETVARAAETDAALADAALADVDLAAVYRGPGARIQVERVRRELAAATVAWWRTSALPSDALLRDGLLALEAGHSLDEAQRTLLARTALVRGHGIFTALHHQTDPERVATLVHEAVMEGTLTPNGLRALLADDSLDSQWVAALDLLLRADLSAPVTAVRAQAARQIITTAFWQGAPAFSPHAVAGAPESGGATLEGDPPSRAWVRIVVAALLLAALLLLWYWRTRAADFGDVIEVPAGAYMVGGEENSLVRVTLPAFVIDRTEVTVEAYARCVESGVCLWEPADRAVLQDAARTRHPMTSVTWVEAQHYCAARAMRLPSTAEWEVAAGFAPATQRNYRFPWGAAWEPALVIGGAENGFTETAAAGSRAPQGDSALGATDMAGNAAEWTATSPPGALDQALVKGGSFKDAAAAFQIVAVQVLPKETRTPWLGFRCAVEISTAP
jgi:hypothetical protein